MNFTEEAKAKLESELLKVNNQISNLSASDPAQSGDRDIDNEMEDDYQESEEGFRAQSLIDEANQNKRKVIRALEKIQAGNYTKCDHCGGLIDENRLIALPATLTCFNCQTKNDRRSE